MEYDKHNDKNMQSPLWDFRGGNFYAALDVREKLPRGGEVGAESEKGSPS